MTNKRLTKRTAKSATTRRKAVIANLAAVEQPEEPLSQYVGNSAALDDATEARLAYERADRWAKGEVGVYEGR